MIKSSSACADLNTTGVPNKQTPNFVEHPAKFVFIIVVLWLKEKPQLNSTMMTQKVKM
jgi:hypothetical protein